MTKLHVELGEDSVRPEIEDADRNGKQDSIESWRKDEAGPITLAEGKQLTLLFKQRAMLACRHGKFVVHHVSADGAPLNETLEAFQFLTFGAGSVLRIECREGGHFEILLCGASSPGKGLAT